VAAAPEELQDEGWAGGLPGTAGLWPESDPEGSSSDQLINRENITKTFPLILESRINYNK